MGRKTLTLLAPALLLSGTLSAQVTMKNIPAAKDRGKRIELKNPFLSVMINVDKAGLVDSFIPAGSGHEEVYVNSAQRCSFGEFRPPEMSYNELHELYATPAVCRIVSMVGMARTALSGLSALVISSLLSARRGS